MASTDDHPASNSKKEIVRRGWNKVSYIYRPPGVPKDCFGHTLTDHREWLQPIFDRVAQDARVLDLGCGCGAPDSLLLATRYRVTGVDISDVQIDRAKSLVPGATFVRADMTEIDFPDASFAAILALYSIIHVPVEEQRTLLRKIHRWLEPGGLALLVTGHDKWTGIENGWLGSDATMYWSHADADTYAGWFAELGFQTFDRRYVPEGGGGHELFLLEKTTRQSFDAHRGNSRQRDRPRSPSP